MSARSLAALERCRDRYGADVAAVKQTLLRTLARTTLATPEQVRRLHEVLCFLRAYPDNAAVLRQVESMLAGFSRRRDLRMHHDALAYSGIAGTSDLVSIFLPHGALDRRTLARCAATGPQRHRSRTVIGQAACRR